MASTPIAYLTTVGGLPLHPLVVHATVVLIPLSALCAVAITLVPAWRRRYGWPVLALTVAAAASVPAAVWSGGELAAARYGEEIPEEIVEHSQLGDQLVPIAIIFAAATALLVALGTVLERGSRDSDDTGDPDTPARADDLYGPRGRSTGDVIDATVPRTAPAAPIRGTERRSTATERVLMVLISLVVIGSAGLATAQVARVGDSGAQSVWGWVAESVDN